ncbi:unnamed protein product, partial [Rotaria magnacalcarata]
MEDNESATHSDSLDNSQEAHELEMMELFEENEDDGSAVSETKKNYLKYKNFVHVFEECSQDSETIVAILNDVFCRVKKTDSQIENAFIQSDNAGCYHSANTIASAKEISDMTGITIKRIDFCDPQGGKGPCDHYVVVIKSNIRRYLSENHNVTNASEFVEKCHSHNGVKGVLAHEREGQQQPSSEEMNEKRNLYDCNVKEGCTAKFI